MTEVLSPRRSGFGLPCVKAAVSHRVCHLWIPSNPSSRCGLLHLKVLLFLGQLELRHVLLLHSTRPETHFGINLSQVELEG